MFDGLTEISVGKVVGADQNVLQEDAQVVEPIYVDFERISETVLKLGVIILKEVCIAVGYAVVENLFGAVDSVAVL